MENTLPNNVNEHPTSELNGKFLCVYIDACIYQIQCRTVGKFVCWVRKMHGAGFGCNISKYSTIHFITITCSLSIHK